MTPQQSPSQKASGIVALVGGVVVALGVFWFLRDPATIARYCPQGQPGPAFTKNTQASVPGNGEYASLVRSDLVREEKLRGIIERVERTPGVDNGFPYQVKLVISLGERNSVTYFLNEADLQHLTVSTVVNGQEQAAGLEQIKAGDRVTVDVQTDTRLPSDRNILQFRITKI